MNSLIKFSSTFVILLLQIFLAGCGNSRTPNMDKSKLPTPNSPYVKVYITKSGEITLDGKTATIEEVNSAFASLAQKKGVVLYSRESSEEYEPHPSAIQVIESVTQNSLPVRLCTNKDCSDALDEKGKLRIED